MLSTAVVDRTAPRQTIPATVHRNCEKRSAARRKCERSGQQWNYALDEGDAK